MAELLAASTAVGVVSSLITLADVAWRVIKRLNEYSDRATDVPVAIKHISAQLPLLVEKIEELRISSNNGVLVPPKSSLAVAIVTCDEAIARMDAISSKMLPGKADSKLKLATKAIRSIKYEKEIGKIWTVLQSYISIFTLHLSELKGVADQTKIPASKPLYTVPFERDSLFIDRPAIFSEIDRRLSAHHRAALAGIGGIGKSQIAIEYSYRFRDDKPDSHVFWIHASNIERFRQAYADIAKLNSIPGWDDAQVDKLQLVFDWLSQCDKQWLLILDNADDLNIFWSEKAPQNQPPVLLIDYIPKSSNGFVLMTTRDIRVGEILANGKSPIIIENMTASEAQALFKSKVSESAWSEAEAKTLVIELEYLPLAIDQATAFIRQNFISTKDYLDLFSAGDDDLKTLLSLELSSSRRDSRAPNSIVRTFKLSIEQIAKEDAYAIEILSLMSMFDRHSIPTMLLRVKEKGVVQFTTALGKLQAFSLIKTGRDNASFALHRLVQISTQAWLEMQQQSCRWQEEALNILYDRVPEGEYSDWKTSEMLIPHCHAVLPYVSISDAAALTCARIILCLAFYETNVGHYKASNNWTEQALKLQERIQGKDHPDTLRVKTLLVWNYAQLGKFNTSLSLQLELLETQKRVVGKDDDTTIANMNTIAYTYSRLGRYAESTAMQTEVVEAQKRICGPNHSETLGAMNNLAMALSNEQKYDEAAALLTQTVEMKRATLGDEHPETLVSMNNLAATYNRQKRHTEAAALHSKVLEVQKRVIGAEHPDRLLNMFNLAMTYSDRGDFVEAEKLHSDVLEIRKRVLDEDHPSTLASMSELALCYHEKGRYAEASTLYCKAQEGYISQLGSDHPETLKLATLVEKNEKSLANAGPA